MVKIKQVIQFLEDKAPLALQESYDNCGLLVGESDVEITGILVSLDVTEAVLEEAILKKCNLIVAHHPLIFAGIKKITGRNSTERIILSAIRNQISIYAMHTNLDNVYHGVNAKLSSKIGLTDCRILQPKSSLIKNLTTYAPSSHAEGIRQALFDAGAGKIGNYDECSFSVTGNGTFRAMEGANPFLGEVGTQHQEKEERIEVIFPAYLELSVVQALKNSHPYEEVAYYILKTDNLHQNIGAGMVGFLSKPMSTQEFLQHLKTTINLEMIRYTSFDHNIHKVAVCGGSGSFLLNDAMAAGAHALVTGDFKYHQFFDAENKIMIADIGHFESEKHTIELIGQWLSDFFPNFAVIFTETNTNPVNYYL
jgi:dinuclear metal center YbgI/SA1388 family protein